MSAPALAAGAVVPTRNNAVVLLVFALLPFLALACFPTLASPFLAPKQAVFVLYSAILTAAALLVLTVTRVRIQDGFRSHIGALALCLIAYVAAVFLSGLRSPLAYLSSPALVWTSATALLLLALPVLTCGRERGLLVSIALAGSVTALIAVAQAVLSFDLFALFRVETAAVGRMRVHGALGNPNFVGAFCAATLPAILGWRATLNGRTSRSLVTALSGLVISAVVCTGSRAAAAATAVGLLVTVWLISRASTRGRTIAIAAAIVLCGLAIAPTGINQRSPAEAASGRLFTWRAALADQSSWLFGSGPNTFAYLYPVRAGKLVSAARISGAERFATYEVHAQNELVEIVSETGVPGLLSFIAIIFAWFAFALRVVVRVTDTGRQEHVLSASAIGGVAALCTAALFDFPFHRGEGMALLCLWISLPLALTLRVESRRPRLTRSALALPIALLILAAGAWFSMCPLLSELHLARGQRWEAAENAAEASAAYRRALRLNPVSASARFNLVRSLAAEGHLTDALQQSDRLVLYLNEPECWLIRARILRALGDPVAAIPELRAAIRAFPYSHELRNELHVLVQTNVTLTDSAP